MKAVITKIHPAKLSQTEGSFIRIEFQLENGRWAKTDVVSRYRNAVRWVEIIKAGVGTVLGDLKLRQENEVDADSFPVILVKPEGGD